MRNIKKSITLIAFLFFYTLTYSGVNIKTGEFYISYSDIEPENNTGVIESIWRRYNSKSTFNGLFGIGWSSELDTYLSIFPDGSLVIHESGISYTYFESALTTDDLVNNMIDDIIKIGIAQGDINNSPDAILENREKLKGQNYRITKWDQYNKKGFIKNKIDFPVGMEWESYGNQKVTKTKTGYTRTKEGKQDSFNFNGQLTRMEAGESFSEFEYSDGKLSKIKNTDGSFYLIETNKDGHAIKISFANETSTYKYDNDNLIETLDAGNNNYKHTYDVDYNMIAINYSDGTSMKIAYSPETYFVTQINYKGEISDYEYIYFYNEDGSEDKKHYATTIFKTDTKGVKRKEYYEYLMKEKENGEEYISKFINEENGIKSIYTMDDLCNNAIEKNIDNQITKFKYDSRCLLVEEVTPSGKIITQKWHPDVDKIIEINDGGLIMTFEYDKDFNMVQAKRSDGKTVALTYDKEKKVTAINMGKYSLSVEYKADGQASVFTIQNLGKTNVSYDDEGILKSDTQTKIASEIMTVFKEMISFIKPAETNLSPEN